MREVDDRWIRVGGISLLWLRDVYSYGLLYTNKPLNIDTLKYAVEFLWVITLRWEAARWSMILCRRRYPHLSQTRKRILLVLPLCWLAAVLVDLANMAFVDWTGYHKPYPLGPNIVNIAVGALVLSGFTTSYDEYAIRAFKVNSIDYLLKPVQKEELRAALDKFLGQTPRRSTGTDTSETVRHLVQELQNGNRLALKLKPTIDKEVVVSREKLTPFKEWMGK